MGGTLSQEEDSVEESRNVVVVLPSVMELPVEPLPLSSAVSRLRQQDEPLASQSWDPTIITLSPGQRFFQDYLKPGIWLEGSSTSEQSTVLAAFDFHKPQHGLPTTHPSEEDVNAPYWHVGGVACGSGVLCLSHSLHPNTHLQLLAPTRGVPSVTLMQWLAPYTQVHANMNANGHGWTGWVFERNFQYPSWLGVRKIMVGSSSEFQLGSDPLVARRTLLNMAPITKLHALAGIDIHGTLLAVTADVPITTDNRLQPFQNNVRALVHSNVNQDETQPPLWWTLQAQPARGLLSVQVGHTVTFDRLLWYDPPSIFAPPRIRNALTWTVEMSNTIATSNDGSSHHQDHAAAGTTGTARTRDDEDPPSTIFNDGTAIGNIISHTTPLTHLRAGMAWQLNSNVTIKAVTTPADGNIRGAIILRRWDQPRLVCSLIGEYNMWNQQGQFVGVGFELGSMSSSCSSSAPTS